MDEEDETLASTDIVWLLGKLWNCTDQVPGIMRRELELERDFHTYGQMARALKPVLVEQIAAGALKPGACRRW